MIDFLQTNWEYVLVVFYILEKVVKLSPVQWDDILVDGLFAIFKRLTGNKDAV